MSAPEAPAGSPFGEYIQFAAEGPFLGKRGFSGSRDLADMQSLDARGEVTEAHVADGVGILGDNLLNRAVGSLKQGLGHDLGLLHDHFFPRFVGAGGRVAGHDHDVGVGAASSFQLVILPV